MAKQILTQEYVKSLFDYNPETGIFLWKVKKSQNTKIGIESGTKNKYGYRVLVINYIPYLAHRIAWLYVYGVIPNKHIDHKNRIRDDNRICNLREVTYSENCQNIKIPKHNSTGCIGVYFNKKLKKYGASIKVNKRNKHLGLFDTIFDAAATRRSAENKIYTLPR